MFRANRGASINGELLHTLAQGPTQVTQTGQILSQLDGDPHELFGAGGDQLRQAEIRQLAQTRPPHDRLPHQGHDRYAHPKRVQAGRVPVVGDRIQSDVDVVVIPQVLLPGLVIDEPHSVAANALLCQKVQRVPAMRPFMSQERQPGSIDGIENLLPKSSGRRG